MRKPKKVYVYLLHFHQPISPKHTTQHYMGSAADLTERLGEHLAGHGSRLCQVALERGITWQVARVWDGGEEGRLLEKKLKAQHNGKALCPICAQGGELVVEGDTNFYSMPADLAGAIAGYSLGERYCKPGTDWAAVEEDRIGD